MGHTRRAVLGATAAIATGLAGCTGSQDGGDGSDGGDVGTPTSESDATVGVRDHPDLGEVLVGPDGRTLYMFDRDTQGDGTSSCSGDCAGAWPPLAVEDEPTAGDGVSADLTTFEREDGSTQVAAAGWPLYYFADDGEPGDANGQGAGDVWWVLGPEGTPKRPEATPTASPTPTSMSSDGGSDPY